MSIYEEKHELYRKYVDELDRFRKKPIHITEKECREICDEYIRSKNSSWHNIYDPATKDLVGFVIIGKEPPEKHPDSLRSIAQAYILPKHRRKGLMTAAVSDYLKRHGGIYSILVLKGNDYAAGFWRRFFKREGYEEIGLAPIHNTGDETVMYAFGPGTGKQTPEEEVYRFLEDIQETETGR